MFPEEVAAANCAVQGSGSVSFGHGGCLAPWRNLPAGASPLALRSSSVWSMSSATARSVEPDER